MMPDLDGLGRPVGRRGGRQKGDPARLATEWIRFHVTKAQRDAIFAAAEADMVPVTWWIMRLIARELRGAGQETARLETQLARCRMALEQWERVSKGEDDTEEEWDLMYALCDGALEALRSEDP